MSAPLKLVQVHAPYCGICSRPCKETFSLRKGNGEPVQVGECHALLVAADIYRVAITFGAEVVNERAVNEASAVLTIFGVRHLAGVYPREA